jgi:hypothetical protein
LLKVRIVGRILSKWEKGRRKKDSRVRRRENREVLGNESQSLKHSTEFTFSCRSSFRGRILFLIYSQSKIELIK